MKSILDVSSIVYGGNPDSRLYGFPIGGIRKVLGIINAGLTTGDFVICFDGGKLLKNELLPVYKAGRVPNYSVLAQIALLKDILIDCNIPFYCETGYEADDFVYSFCNYMGQVWDLSGMTIYSDDRDLACCVTETTSLRNVTSNGKIINRQNFETQVVSGHRVPFNTILLWKMFHGDSDNYKGLKVPSLYYESACGTLLDWIRPLIDSEQMPEIMYSNKEVCQALFEDIGTGLSEVERREVKAKIDIVYPMLVKVSDVGVEEFLSLCQQMPIYKVEQEHMKICTLDIINRNKFETYCGMLHLNRVRGRKVDEDSPEVVAFRERLQLESKSLQNGEIAVMRYGNYKVERPEGLTLKNMEIPV